MDVKPLKPNEGEERKTIRHPRTQGREIALQYLYMHDALNGQDVQLLSDFLGLQETPPDEETVRFTRELVEAVTAHREELDKDIAEAATNWKLSRMALVDRNILRLGLAELIVHPATSHKVVINEAVELARQFSSDASCGFVNGLLDRLRQKVRPNDSSSQHPQTPPAEPA
ncbi:MAG: N utilization substance protein B [Planctomycetota bacterium]